MSDRDVSFDEEVEERDPDHRANFDSITPMYEMEARRRRWADIFDAGGSNMGASTTTGPRRPLLMFTTWRQ